MELNKYIDHTVLKPETTIDKVQKLCEEAIENNFAAVCVNPSFVGMCAFLLKDSDVKVCTVIGFPLGMNTIATKVFEAENAILNGADEIDMVINIGAAKGGAWEYVLEDITAVANVVHKHGKLLKVIVEVCLLTEEEQHKVAEVVLASGADYIKTSTGFSTGGATLEALKIMNEHCGGKIGIKAAGGVRNIADAKAFIEAGATRLGTSSGVALVTTGEAKAGQY